MGTLRADCRLRYVGVTPHAGGYLLGELVYSWVFMVVWTVTSVRATCVRVGGGILPVQRYQPSLPILDPGFAVGNRSMVVVAVQGAPPFSSRFKMPNFGRIP